MAATGWTQGVRNGLEVVEIATPASTCTIALHGAQVLGFAPRGRSRMPVDQRQGGLRGRQAAARRDPDRFPWFGPHAADPKLPPHGFARTRLWRLAGVEALDAERVRAELELTSDATTAPLFPHPFVARLAVTAGEALELAFEVVNSGDAPFEFEIALHTYFAVSDVGAVAIRGLGGCAYTDRVAGGARDQQDRRGGALRR